MEKAVYSGKFITVTEEEINGKVYERAHCVPGVHIIPITSEGKILLIREFRAHETPSERWKLVGGVHEPGKTLEEAALQELREELKKSGTITPYISVNRKGTFSEQTSIVLATNLVDDPRPNPDGDVVLETKAFSLDEIYAKLLSGEFLWGGTMLALIRLRHEVETGKINLSSQVLEQPSNTP